MILRWTEFVATVGHYFLFSELILILIDRNKYMNIIIFNK